MLILRILAKVISSFKLVILMILRKGRVFDNTKKRDFVNERNSFIHSYPFVITSAITVISQKQLIGTKKLREVIF